MNHAPGISIAHNPKIFSGTGRNAVLSLETPSFLGALDEFAVHTTVLKANSYPLSPRPQLHNCNPPKTPSATFLLTIYPAKAEVLTLDAPNPKSILDLEPALGNIYIC